MPKSKGNFRSFAISSKTSLKAPAPTLGMGPRRGPPREAIIGKIEPKGCMQCYCILDIVYTVYGILCTVFTGRVSGRSYCVLLLVAVFQAVFQAVLLYTVHRTYCTLLGLKKVDI